MGAEALDTFDTRMDNQKDFSIEVSGGSGPNFDDFDQIETAREEYVEEKTPEAKAEKQEPKEQEAEDTKEPAKESFEDQEDRAESHEQKVEEDENIEPKMAPDPEETEVRMIKTLNGEEEMELPHDLQVPVRIDGEDTMIPVQELINNFSGETVLERRFSEVNSAKKQLLEERAQFEDLVKPFIEKVKNDQSLDGIFYLVDRLGGNSHDLFKELRTELMEKALEYANMSEAERAAYDKQLENDFLRKQMESKEQRYAEQQSQRELYEHIDALRETYEVSEDQFTSAYSELSDMAKNRVIDVGEEGITPEQVVLYEAVRPVVNLATDLISSVDENLLVADVISEVSELLLTEDVTEEEVVEMLRDSTGTPEKETSRILSEKTSHPGVVKTKKVAVKGHVESFDDYDEEWS